MLEHKLENPVWNSLCETHESFAIDYGNLKFYHSNYCPFGAFEATENTNDKLAEYAKLTSDFFIVGQKPELPKSLKLNFELVCLQMIIEEKINLEITEEIIKLNPKNYDELYDLVCLVQPGYFKPQTPLMGDYYGIFKNNKLVAAAGERMKMHDFTEVSAIVTHPEHTKMGYAMQLTATVVNKIFDENKIPFLHVSKTNTSAKNLYKKLGFRERREISLWNIEV